MSTISPEREEQLLLEYLAEIENPYVPRVLQGLAQIGGFASLTALPLLAKTSVKYAQSPVERERIAITYVQVAEEIIKRHPEFSGHKQNIVDALLDACSYVKTEDVAELRSSFDGPTDIDNTTLDSLFEKQSS
ncbi:hypothetical protein D6774_04485 [Candidatus Woesearchaeota archaeon]|nr:MAG: hypothetical protein D6774_04485 [Candidatus Woesearchaeota archaeon]